MPTDYYLVLGVNRDASEAAIKKAYRRIAKKYHPDGHGTDISSEKFRQATEAYETLTDSEKRRKYDDKLKKLKSSKKPGAPSSPCRRRPDIIDTSFSHPDLFSEKFRPRSGAEEECSGLHARNLFIEAVLSPREAEIGVILPLAIPVNEVCFNCRGTGIGPGLFCPVCGGTGMIHGTRRFSVNIPPKIRHGTRFSISLENIGLMNVNLNVIVRIEQYYIDDVW